MKTVFVVERGEYSDYRVVGVYSTRELAEKVAAHLNDEMQHRYASEATVAEWPLDPFADEIGQGLAVWTVNMDRDGNTSMACKTYNLNVPLDCNLFVFHPTQVFTMNSTAWARDEVHAVEIANGRRAQLVASGEWDRQAGG